MHYQYIEFNVNKGVAVLHFNRPKALNSFTRDMHLEVRDALTRAAENTEVRSLLLTGNGRGFCAGQDLAEIAPAEDGGAMADLDAILDGYYNPLIRQLSTLPKPIICAVNGVAAGAGANIALACDIVIAARSASFIESFARLGLIPDSGGTWILPRLVGMARAKGMAMLGTKISAEQAVAWGLIWQCTEDADLWPTALALAEQLATQPTRGFALTKEALKASSTNSLEQQLELERRLMGVAGKTHDYREGVTAFLQKRAAVYRGE